MKVVHICTQDNGGAGNAAYRLNEGLRKIGFDSKLIVFTKTKDNPNVYAIPDDYETTKKLIDSAPYYSKRMNGMWQFWFDKLKNEFPERPPGLEIFTTNDYAVDLSEIKEIREADVINLHWVAGMLSFNEATQKLFAEKKIVWTLHDMNPFTGGCHYSSGCEKYKSACGACPQLGSKTENDLSRKQFEIKQNFYSNFEINVVTPSKWLGAEARKSVLLGNFNVSVIPNGFPADIFTPYPPEIVKEKMGLPQNSKIILFGAAYATERKGFRYLLEALNMIEADEKTYLGVFGELPQIEGKLNNFEIIQFGDVKDETLLAMLYSMADVFVIPSLEDNLPNVVPEAMLCGTPVVGFSIGGIPDMIEHKKDGYLAQPKNAEDLAQGIVWTLNNNPRNLGKKAREKASKVYSLETQAHGYKNLYEKIIGKNDVIKKSINIIKETVFPKITIVTPSFNQGEFLEETITSILDQQYPNLEYIIMDGGSMDNSVEIIKKYEKHLAYWQSKPDNGQYAAITEGFKRSTGEIMTWLNSDDMLMPLSLLTVASIFNQFQYIDWITGRGCIHFQKKNLTAFTEVKFWNRKDYLAGNYKFIQQEGTFWRRSLYEKAGGYVNSDYKLASDLELWVRFFRHAKIYTLDAPLGIFRSHGDQKSVNFLDEYLKEAEEIIRKENELVAKAGEEFDNTNYKLSLAAVEMLSYKKAQFDINEKINVLKAELNEKSKKDLLHEINPLFYFAARDKRLYELQIEYYDKLNQRDLANMLLWRATIQFNDVDLLVKLIISELLLGRQKNVKALIKELIRISPNHPFIKNILEFNDND